MFRKLLGPEQEFDETKPAGRRKAAVARGNRMRYMPHQGAQEMARRARRGDALPPVNVTPRQPGAFERRS